MLLSSPHRLGGRIRPAPRAPLRCAAIAAAIALAGLAAVPAAATTSHNTSLVGKAGHITRGVWGWSNGTQEYALVCTRSSLEVYDVTDPALPNKIATVPSLGQDLLDVRTKDHYAIAINQCGPVQIIDLSNPAAVQTVATYRSPTLPGAHTLFVAGDYAYLSLWGAGQGDFRILDLSDPLAPAEAGFWQHPDLTPPGTPGVVFGSHGAGSGSLDPTHTDTGVSCQWPGPGAPALGRPGPGPQHGGEGVAATMAHDCFVRGDTAFVACGGSGFAVVDVSDKSAPVTLALVPYEHAVSHSTWLTEDGSHVLHCDEKQDGRLTVWDVRDFSQITQVGTFETAPGHMIHNAYVQGDLAFLAYYTDGLRVLDISNPAEPVEIAFFDHHVGPDGGYFEGAFAAYPYAPSGHVYVTDMKGGLHVFAVDRTIRAGFVAGQVTDGAEGFALPGAEIEFVEMGKTIRADSLGGFRHGLPEGPHTVVVRHYGYESETASLTVAVGAAALHMPALERRAFGGLQLRVHEWREGQPLEGVAVTIPELPGGVRYSDTEGLVDWGVVPVGEYTATLGHFGYATRQASLRVWSPADGDPITPTLVMDYGISDDGGVDQGWHLGAPGDDAHHGQWVRDDPSPSWSVFPGAVAPDWDANGTPFGFAYHTGYQLPDQPQNLYDVDQGRVTLLSPRFDLTPLADPELVYDRWFSNDTAAFPGEDPFRAEISNDDGATWVLLEEVWQSQRSWVRRNYPVLDYLPATEEMRLRFVARDEGGDSIVEAAVDRIRVNFQTVDAPAASGSGALTLLAPAPNPAPGGRTTIRFRLPRDAQDCRVALVDARGRVMRWLLRGPRPAGAHAVSLRESGSALAPGLYWIRVDADGEAQTQKVVVLGD